MMYIQYFKTNKIFHVARILQIVNYKVTYEEVIYHRQISVFFNLLYESISVESLVYFSLASSSIEDTPCPHLRTNIYMYDST